MQRIANTLGIPYDNHYIELRNKGNVMFDDGSVVDVHTAQIDKFVSRYNENLNDRVLKLLKRIK